MGGTTTPVTVERGLHNLYVQATGAISSVMVFNLDPATTLCIDNVRVGRAVPGAPLRAGASVPPPRETSATFPVLDTLRAVGRCASSTTTRAFWAGAYTNHGAWGPAGPPGRRRRDLLRALRVPAGPALPGAARAGRPAPATGALPVEAGPADRPGVRRRRVAALAAHRENAGLGRATGSVTLLMADIFVADQLPGRADPDVEPRRRGGLLLRPAAADGWLARRPGRRLGRAGSVGHAGGAGRRSTCGGTWRVRPATVDTGAPTEWLPAYLTLVRRRASCWPWSSSLHRARTRRLDPSRGRPRRDSPAAAGRSSPD